MVAAASGNLFFNLAAPLNFTIAGMRLGVHRHRATAVLAAVANEGRSGMDGGGGVPARVIKAIPDGGG